MGTTSEFSSGHNADINAIPMLDILLVLLVIFMVSAIPPLMAPIRLPPPDDEASGSDDSPAIVLELPDAGGFLVNGTAVLDAELDMFIAGVYDGRPGKRPMVAPGRQRKYSEVIDAMDRAYGVGVQVVGLMPPRH